MTAPAGWPSRSRSPRSATRASPARPSARTRRCCPAPTGRSGTTAPTTTMTPTTPRRPGSTPVPDHQGPQPGQRHPVAVQPAGGRPVLRALRGRHPADHQPGPGRRPAGRQEHAHAPGQQRWLGLLRPWVWTSRFPMTEPSAASIPWMVTTGNHKPELFSTRSRPTTRPSTLWALGYGGLVRRVSMPVNMPGTGPAGCPSVCQFTYGNVGIISLEANELSWEIQGLLNDSRGRQVRWLEATLKAWRAGRRSTSSSRSSTSARSAPPTGTAPTGTAPTAASAPRSPRCSRYRSTSRSRGTTTSTSGPARWSATPRPTAPSRASRRSPAPPASRPRSSRPRSSRPRSSRPRSSRPRTAPPT